MSFAVTFGSIGDVIAVTQIVSQIISALKDSSGSAAQYQQLFAELKSLRELLGHLNELSTHTSHDVKILDSIKFATAACYRPLEAFQKRINKYHRFLGGDIINPDTSDDESTYSNEETSIRDKCKTIIRKLESRAKKVQWEFTTKKDVQELQNYLCVHIQTINALIAVHGLEKMKLNAAANQENHKTLESLIDCTQQNINEVSSNIDAQALLIRNTSNTIEKLLGLVTEWNTPWKAINNVVSNICSSTQKIHGLLLEIKGAVVDVRWQFFQAPLLVEDALGQRFPVPSEYDFGLLQDIIMHRFKDGSQVSSIVCRGDYELSYARNSTHILREGGQLRPGSLVIMAVILSQTTETVACPVPSCRSTEYHTLQSGGLKCSACDAWFDNATRTSIQEIVEDDDNSSPNLQNQRHCVEHYGLPEKKRGRLEDLRNIRVLRIPEKFMSSSTSFVNKPVAMPYTQKTHFKETQTRMQAQQMRMRKATGGRAHLMYSRSPYADDDNDDVSLRDAPTLKPRKVQLRLPSFYDNNYDYSSDDDDMGLGHCSQYQTKHLASLGDAVLVHYMDHGMWPIVASQAAQDPTPSEDDDDDNEGDDSY